MKAIKACPVVACIIGVIVLVAAIYGVIRDDPVIINSPEIVKAFQSLRDLQHKDDRSIVIRSSYLYEDGYRFGRRLLTKLKSMGVSVIVSTQITALAEFGRDKLGAEAFQVDSRHRIKPGIGQGGMDRLVKANGLDKLLDASSN